MEGPVAAIAILLAAQAVSTTEAPASPATLEDSARRDKEIGDWGAANRPVFDAALAENDDRAALARIRAAAEPKLGPLSDGELVPLLLAGADEQIAAGANARGRRLGKITLDLAAARRLGPGVEYDALSRTGAAAYFDGDYAGAARDLGLAVEKAALIRPYEANSVANAGANHAVILDQAGRYQEAEAALTRAIALRREASPIKPAGLAGALSSRAAVYARMGRFDRADGDYRAALSTFEQAGLQASRGYVRALHNYAVLLGKTGRDVEAAALYRRSLDLMEPELRHAPNAIPDHSALAASLMGTGELDAAEAALRDAIAIADKLPKPDVDVAAAYSNRSKLRELRGDLEGAEADARRALEIDRAVRGGDSNIDVPLDLAQLSMLLARRGASAEAEQTAAAAVAAFPAIPPENPLRAVILDTQAAALASGGKAEAALASSRAASELLAGLGERNSARDPGPIPPEQRPIMPRRIELLWEQAHR